MHFTSTLSSTGVARNQLFLADALFQNNLYGSIIIFPNHLDPYLTLVASASHQFQ